MNLFPFNIHCISIFIDFRNKYFEIEILKFFSAYMSFFKNKPKHLINLIGLSCVLVKLKGLSFNIEFLPKLIFISGQFAQAYRNSKVIRALVYYTWIARSSTIKSDIIL